MFRWLQDERTAAETRLKAMRFPIDQGIAGSVFASGKPEMILNIAEDSRHLKSIDQLTKSKTRSMIAVPLDKKKKISACEKPSSSGIDSTRSSVTAIPCWKYFGYVKKSWNRTSPS